VDGVPAGPLSQANRRHASGSPDGRWVVADNWHPGAFYFKIKN